MNENNNRLQFFFGLQPIIVFFVLYKEPYLSGMPVIVIGMKRCPVSGVVHDLIALRPRISP